MNVSASTDIVPYVEANPVLVIQDEALRERFYAECEKRLTEFEPDLTTDKGRKAVASFARKFASTKTAIDDAGKKLVEDIKKQTSEIDAIRREARAKLDDMRDRARAPLDEWEAEEEERKKKHMEVISFLQRVTVIYESTTFAEVTERLEQLRDVPDTPAYIETKTVAIESLTAAGARIKQQEADREELRMLREAKAKAEAEEEARKRAEAQKAELAEKAESARIRAHEHALAILGGMIADASSSMNSSQLIKHIEGVFEGMEEHKRDWQEFRPRYEETVAEGRKRISERLAVVEKYEEERRVREREKIEAEAIAYERRRVEALEKERLAAEKKAEDDRKRLAENRRHRTKVETEAVDALAGVEGMNKELASRVVSAIRDGVSKYLTLNY